MKKMLFLGCCLFLAATAPAQTLFTYGNETVTVNDFLKAYKKNNEAAPKDKHALQNYLDLYIASRLKIKEAKALRMDTLPQLVADLQSLRSQIMPAYLNDEAAINKLVDEAFRRSQKDIRVAHIFIAAKEDSVVAKQKAAEVFQKLQKGGNFAQLAAEYSDDPSAKQNGGELGYITAFSLPYALENLVYQTAVGKLSPIYRSKAGYHIFKNLGERKAIGRIKASQILLAVPPEAGNDETAAIKNRIDSIYQRLLKGDDFEMLASQFSNDMISAAAKGHMPEFGVGQYLPDFENAIYTLGANKISKPFLTTHGWHIVKKEAINPVSAKKDEATLKSLKEKVEASDRIKTLQQERTAHVIKTAGLKQASFKMNELHWYTDSALDHRTGQVYAITNDTRLFTLGKTAYLAKDWVEFARNNRYKIDASGLKSYPQLWEDFISLAADIYYKQNLENYNPAFKAQIDEFRDGNLFFEIMQQKVWGPAQTDTTGLLDYYKKHQAKYTWGESADAIVFYAGDTASAASLHQQLTKDAAAWKTLVADYNDKVAIDSNRFEWAQIPNAKNDMKAGSLTATLINEADNTASFAYIIKTYPAGQQRSFAEAKGMVINDYQAKLEEAWVEALKKKYPVRVNQQALSAVLNRK